MKILYHHRTRSHDGQRIHIDALIGALRRAGHEVVESGPRPHPVQTRSRGSSATRPSGGFRRALRELLEFGYNVVELWRLLVAARALRPDALYSRHALYCLAPRIAARVFRIPWFIEVNAPLAWERTHYGGLYFRRLATWLETSTLNAADQIIVVTRVMAEHLGRQGVDERKIDVQFNGIDPERCRAVPDAKERRREAGIWDKFVVGFVGFVRDWNRLERVYPFLRRHPAAILWIVGDGPDRGRLEALAAEQNLSSQLHFTGATPSDQVMAQVAMFDVAILPESTEYASPLKLLDYLAAGKPILAPDRPNIREILVSGENAMLFAADAAEDFTAKLSAMYEDGRLRERLAAGSAATIERQGLTWDHHARRVVEQFQGRQGDLRTRPVES